MRNLIIAIDIYFSVCVPACLSVSLSACLSAGFVSILLFVVVSVWLGLHVCQQIMFGGELRFRNGVHV